MDRYETEQREKSKGFNVSFNLEVIAGGTEELCSLPVTSGWHQLENIGCYFLLFDSMCGQDLLKTLAVFEYPYVRPK